MVKSDICPICGTQETSAIHSHNFAPKPLHLLPREDLPEAISPRDERLWIFFNHIVNSKNPVQMEMRQCNTCGFIFTNPRLNSDDIQTKYHILDQLGEDKLRHQKNPATQTSERGRRVYKLFQEQVSENNQEKPLKVLDYGGAEGHLLVPFLEHGHQGYLIDFLQYPVSDDRIHYLGKNHQAIPEGERFDFIMLLHTLEHVVDPVNLIQTIKSFLKPEGLLYVEVPLGAWMEWKFLKEPITHLNFFSEQSLGKVFEKAGLQITFAQSQWQWVTHGKSPCINLVGKPSDTQQNVELEKTNKQKRTLYYFKQPIKENPPYYTKLILKSLFQL